MGNIVGVLAVVMVLGIFVTGVWVPYVFLGTALVFMLLIAVGWVFVMAKDIYENGI